MEVAAAASKNSAYHSLGHSLSWSVQLVSRKVAADSISWPPLFTTHFLKAFPLELFYFLAMVEIGSQIKDNNWKYQRNSIIFTPWHVHPQISLDYFSTGFLVNPLNPCEISWGKGEETRFGSWVAYMQTTPFWLLHPYESFREWAVNRQSMCKRKKVFTQHFPFERTCNKLLGTII